MIIQYNDLIYTLHHCLLVSSERMPHMPSLPSKRVGASPVPPVAYSVSFHNLTLQPAPNILSRRSPFLSLAICISTVRDTRSTQVVRQRRSSK